MNKHLFKLLASAAFAIFFSAALIAQDNLGNHTATQNLNMNVREIDRIKHLDMQPGVGNALRFWSNNYYSISMGNSSAYKYGPVTDYSIKNNMYPIAGRGWTWGSYNQTPVAALNTQGTFQVKKDLFAFGNFGLGTTSPSEKLHVQDGSILISSSGSNGDPEICFDDGNYTAYKGQWAIEYWSSENGLNFFKPWPSPSYGNFKFFLHNNGNIGIGTGTPDYKLDVCGTVRAKEVRVETGWCDYVFEDDYELRSLEEVEAFIIENKHLPDVPKGSDIEENGLKLAEMQATHMLKIEELTLYMIEVAKEVKQLKVENAQLQQEIELLKNGK